MKSLVIALICLAVVGELALAARSSLHEWTQYKRQFGKSYDSQAEDARRFANFMATKEIVERHNAKANSTYKMGLNQMSDWSPEERTKPNRPKLDPNTRRHGLGNSASDAAHLAKIVASLDESLPNEFDWRKFPGRVTSVKDQGSCFADYAFATIGALEAQEVVHGLNKTGNVSLSAQELVDCTYWNIYCNACDGGAPADALMAIHDAGGIQTEEDYPYIGKEQGCLAQADKAVMTYVGVTFLPKFDEANLKEVLVKFGPIIIMLQATDNFANYKSGIFEDDVCIDDVNHSALLVGYGTDPKDGDYWIFKNSWGTNWGEQGYFRTKRGDNTCGIEEFPVIPKF